MLLLILQQMRVKSWSKNLLIFLPSLAAQSYSQLYSMSIWCLFLVFCLLSSSVYVMNDIRDLGFDKYHPEKSKRPIANGTITVTQGVTIILFCAGVSMFLMTFLDFTTFAIVCGFLFINVLYSFGLKSIANLELLLVASGYFLRCFSGAREVDIELSFWFYMIIGFSSLTLITGKRLAEMSQDIDFKRLVLASYSREYLKVVYGVCLCSSMNFVFLWINEKFGSDPKNILAGVLLTLVLFEHGRVTLGKKSPEVEFPERWIVRNLHLLGLSMLAGLILYV